MKKNVIIYLLLASFSVIYSYERYVDFELIKKAGSPRFVQDGILFTLPGSVNQKAFLRTDMDNWKNNYFYQKSLYNVYYLFIPIKENVKNIRYKININGYWTTDPNNPLLTEDDIGNQLSFVEITGANDYFSESPVIQKNKDSLYKVIFKYYNPKAKEVNFVSSVDNWNEYSHQMTNNGSGLWEITKYFTPGKYFYYFFVDGEKTIDLDNSKIISSPEKGQICYFIIK